jgi:hypothetical protein
MTNLYEQSTFHMSLYTVGFMLHYSAVTVQEYSQPHTELKKNPLCSFGNKTLKNQQTFPLHSVIRVYTLSKNTTNCVQEQNADNNICS